MGITLHIWKKYPRESHQDAHYTISHLSYIITTKVEIFEFTVFDDIEEIFNNMNDISISDFFLPVIINYNTRGHDFKL